MQNGSSPSPASFSNRLEGKVAIITGGASGIGETAARFFVKYGAKVAIADIQGDLGLALSKEISVDYFHCNVTNEVDVQNVVDAVVSKHGKLDILYSNAGVYGKPDLDILSTDYENFKRLFDVNVYGAFLAAKHAARVMIPAKKGSIIFTASIVSVMSGDVGHTYVPAKCGLVGFMKSLCLELGEFGIRVNCISPFGVATPLLRNALGNLEKSTVEAIVSEAANLKGVVLEMDDVAEAAVYLGSEESKYVSGLNLILDGGYSVNNVAFRQSVIKFTT